MKVDINNVLPRHRTRVPKTLDYWKKRKIYPKINVCYARDIDKLIILNGHHRYFNLLKKGIKEIDVIIDMIQRETKFDKYNMPIA